jgi:5'-nucleotidase
MKEKPNILITNDDGINAPGIRHLWNALNEVANVTIIAPMMEQSATSLSITIRQPLHIEKFKWPQSTSAWQVNGTPADCVKLALSVILETQPDLIVSGINRGTNSGRNILYSGTVAAVIEGVMRNIPGIAFSCRDYKEPDYQITEEYITKIVQYTLQHSLPKGTFLNINFPYKALPIQGLKLTKHGKEYWMENPNERSHPSEGHSYYWLGAKLATFDEEEDSDISWLNQGYIAAVPVQIGELTDYQHLKKCKNHFEEIYLKK